MLENSETYKNMQLVVSEMNENGIEIPFKLIRKYIDLLLTESNSISEVYTYINRLDLSEYFNIISVESLIELLQEGQSGLYVLYPDGRDLFVKDSIEDILNDYNNGCLFAIDKNLY